MSPAFEEDHWDFAPVLSLLDVLSIGGEAFTENQSTSEKILAGDVTYISKHNNGIECATQLGDFEPVWRFLNQPLNVPPPQVPRKPGYDAIELSTYVTKNEQSPLKAVKWRDELEGGDLADNDEGNDLQDLSGLNKQQRKKARRKQRREALSAGLTNGGAPPSGSENESEKDSKPPRTPDTKGIIYELLHGHPPKDTAPQGVISRLRSGKPYKLADSIGVQNLPVASLEPAKQAFKVLEPLRDSAYAIAAAKKARLMSLLYKTFIDERAYLSNPGNGGTTATEDGIHVFIDASNVSPDGIFKSFSLLTTHKDNDRLPRRPQTLSQPTQNPAHAPSTHLFPQPFPDP